EFIKFLNDDDVLTPDCVERLLDGFRKYPDITLAFSKRLLIDQDDRPLCTLHGEICISNEDGVLDGRALAAGTAALGGNLIGEPTSTLFRKQELMPNKHRPHFMSFAGHDRIVAGNDLAAWFNLLSAGNAAYVVSPLSYFRIHAEQDQKSAEYKEANKISSPQVLDGAFRLGLSGSEPEIVSSMILPEILSMKCPPSVFLNAETAKLTCLAEQKDCPWSIFDRLGDLAKETGDDARAIFWYARAAERAGEVIDENLKLVELLLETDRFAEAVPVLERYLERFPENGEAREYLTTAREARDTLKNGGGGAVTAGTLLDYWRWRECRLDPLAETLHRERIEKLWQEQPLFEILLILEPGQEALLADSIDSLARQAYAGWRLGIFAQDASPEPGFVAEDSPVRWIQCARDELGERVDAHLAESPADWFGFFTCGAQFSPETFLTLGDYIAIRPQWTLIYTDDDCVAANGGFHSPRFKPDLNLEFLRSTDYVGGFFIEKQALASAGGFFAIPGAERYDLLLRAIDASGEAAIGHIPEVLVHCPDFAPARADDEGATKALRRHFERREIPVSIEPGLIAGETRRVVYRHEARPRVSIIIPTRNRLDLLGPCIETLFKNTFYPNWELLIVDNDSDDPRTFVYYDRLRELAPDRVRIVPVPGDFDFSAMNNRAARQASGEYLLLLNNDTECIHGEWLDAMMSHAQRADVGIVGARLLFPKDRRLQHAGMVLGLASPTSGHVFFNGSRDEPAYMNRAFVDNEYSVLTGACMLVRASVFHQVAGLDPEFRLLQQDVDLCLRIKELGYRVIWTPHATLLHHSSASLKCSQDQPQTHEALGKETEMFVARWRHRLASDPAWNRHLALNCVKPTIEKDFVVPWNTDFHERPRVLYLPGISSPTVEYRGQAPLRALNARGALHYAAPRRETWHFPTPRELDRLAPDSVIMHAPVGDAPFMALASCARFNPEIFLIYSFDGLLDQLPENHPRYSGALTEKIRRGLAVSHRLIVSTEPLADAFRDAIEDIRVLPDALEWRVWGTLQTKRPRGEKLRVGWADERSYVGDIPFMREVVKATCKDVDWISFGAVPEELRPCVAEFHEAPRDFRDHPEKLASLDLDLALAPLEINPVNEARSNLTLLEYGILGWPTLCTDVFPYQTGNPPVTRLPNDPRQWIAAILERAGEAEALAREGEALREWVKAHHLLENRLDLWLSAVSR
ncbi:MAG: glycosyltransferase family 2 protein, partial [Candidatus Accumulibacter sp.]|nr:glycosyltransferase family 2 protein [Accumulibacter sp.]